MLVLSRTSDVISGAPCLKIFQNFKVATAEQSIKLLLSRSQPLFSPFLSLLLERFPTLNFKGKEITQRAKGTTNEATQGSSGRFLEQEEA